jgi:hypothetical protein
MTLSAYNGTNAPTFRVQFRKSGTWTDSVSSHLREININRGRSRSDQDMPAGTATIVFDNGVGAGAGIYDPDYTSASTWVVSGASIINIDLPCRIIATWASVDYTIFAGYLEDVQSDPGYDSTVAMTFIDGIAKIARTDMPARKSFSYNGETISTRVDRLLTSAGWTLFSRNINGTHAMQSTKEGMNVMALIRQCADAQAGVFYMSRTGAATLLEHTDKFTRPTQLFLDDQRSQSYSLEYDSIKTTAGALQVINNAIITRGNLKQKVSTITSSVTKWGKKTVTKEALLKSEKSSQNLALLYAKKDSNPKTSVSEIGFMALGLDVLYPDLLETDLMDMVTVKRTTVDGRSLTMSLSVEGIRHQISADNWRCTLSTSPMNSYRITI